MTTRARTRLAALALALGALAAGCGEEKTQTDRTLGKAKHPEVRIAVADPDSYRVFQPYVAEALGFLEDERIAMRVVDSGDDEAALDVVAAGHADLALVGAPAAIRSLAGGKELRIVYESAPGGAVSIQVPCGNCTTNASVRFGRLAELEGHTLGVAGGEASKQFLTLSLARQGLRTDAIKTKDIDGPGEAREAFDDGDIDAYLAPDERLDASTESTSIVPVDVPSGVFVSARLAGRRVLVGRALRAWARASYAAILNTSLSETLPDRISGRKEVHLAVDDAQPPSAGEEVYGETGDSEEPDGYAYSYFSPRGSDVFGELEPRRLRRLASTMRKAGLITRVPRLAEALDDRLLATANRFDRDSTWCRSRRWQRRNVTGTEDMKPCKPRP